MANHTWADLYIPEGAQLADLSGILWDFEKAREFAEMIASEFRSEGPNWRIVEALSIAAVVIYSRPFSSGARYRFGEKELGALTPKQRAAHEHLRAYRDKHVAHSVNELEENITRANYCVETVKEEGITSISYGGGRVVSLGGREVDSVIELSKVFEALVKEEIAAERLRLLPIVRSLPLEKVLAGGQKAFWSYP